jgi:hypothetical protein
MNRYPLWKYILIARRAAARRAVHGAELLRRIAGAAGHHRQGDGQDHSDTTALVEAALKRDGIRPAEAISLEGAGTPARARALRRPPTPSSRPSWRSSAT